MVDGEGSAPGIGGSTAFDESAPATAACGICGFGLCALAVTLIETNITAAGIIMIVNDHRQCTIRAVPKPNRQSRRLRQLDASSCQCVMAASSPNWRCGERNELSSSLPSASKGPLMGRSGRAYSPKRLPFNQLRDDGRDCKLQVPLLPRHLWMDRHVLSLHQELHRERTDPDHFADIQTDREGYFYCRHWRTN